MSKRLAVKIATFVVLVAIAAAAGGIVVAWSGIFTVSAAAGHWPITAWFLHFAMRHSVNTHSIGITAPSDLDSETRVLVGLGHYQGACAVCHGAPGRAHSPVVRRELPEPPYLPDEIRKWDAADLFWIVKNGVKMTGMPGWPVRHRDDEVWNIVAALRRLSGLDAAAYHQLIAKVTSAPPAIEKETAAEIAATGGIGPDIAACGRCHGMDGRGGARGGYPRLAGQRERYLHDSLDAFARGARPSGIMGPVAATLSASEIDQLAAYFARSDAPPAPPSEPKPDAGGLGAQLVHDGIPAHGVPACDLCHDDARPYPDYPKLDGLSAFYIADQLRLWRSGHRGGTPLADVMTAVGRHLTDADIAALAAYYGRRDVEAVAAKRTPVKAPG